MAKLKNMIIILFALLFISGCETEPKGDIIGNMVPDLDFSSYNPALKYRTNKRTRINWSSNDIDGIKTKYYWSISADSSVNSGNVLNNSSIVWNMTDKMYADVAFPFEGSVKDTLVNQTNNSKIIYVKSRIFLYSVDENGNRSKVISREYWRTNTRPKRPIVQCPAFLWDPQNNYSYQDYQITKIPRMFLAAKTDYWNPVLFRWSSEDSDSEMGDKVVLKYRWILKKYQPLSQTQIDSLMENKNNAVDRYPADSVSGSGNWDENVVNVELSKQVFDAGVGYFKLIVKVLDDGNQESEKPCVSVFEAFRPVFDKGILLIDVSTANNATQLIRGNPDKAEIVQFQKNMLQYCGYTESSQPGLNNFSYHDGDQIFLKKMSEYRMVYVYSDTRKDNPSDQINSKLEGSLGLNLITYLKMGGKVFITGQNMLYQPNLTVTTYTDPQRLVLPGTLLKDYIGLATITSGETFEARPNPNYKNYDFIGAVNYTHTPDLKAMTIDSVRINKYYKDYTYNSTTGKITKDWTMKGNGRFYPGITTLSVSKGEIIFGYKSVWQDPVMSQDPNLVLAGGWYDGLDISDSIPKFNCINRNVFDGVASNSALGTRYIPDDDLYRVAVINLPLSFMDNSNNAVYDNVKAMINWFEPWKTPSSMLVKK